MKPLGVLAHPGVIGRALQGVVQGHLDALGGSRLHQGHELCLCAQLGVDGAMAPVEPADGPGAAGIAVLGHQGVAGPLAMAGADGMDGRQVQHVETQRGNPVQFAHHPPEPAVGAGKQLVPGGELRPVAIYPDLQLGAAGLVPARHYPAGHRGHLLVQGGLKTYRARTGPAAQLGDGFLHPRPAVGLVIKR